MSLFNINTEEKKYLNPYSKKFNIPQYNITGECPTLFDCLNENFANELVQEIKKSSVSEEEKEFLIKATKRHYKFNYRNIAEYYAHASKEMQELMERSALVIIDYDDAIKNGYVRLSTDIDKMVSEDEV